MLGITGRLNGAGAEAFWGQSTPHAGPQPIHHHSKLPVGPSNGSGWEEPSPPTQRRNMPNYDDGTSLWGNPQQGIYHFRESIKFHLCRIRIIIPHKQIVTNVQLQFSFYL